MKEYKIRLRPEFKIQSDNHPSVKADRVVHNAGFVEFYKEGENQPVLLVPAANILAVEEVEVKDE